ncbi:MAG TPA: hypothetical protein DEB06_02920 [Phycisphaerales bacterium]|nr:hypothetical protein [Phycisphaerales bacterium]
MKALKYALLALAPIVLIAGLIITMRSGSDRPVIPTDMTMLDVVTGEVTVMSRSKIVALPWKNSRDAKYTLYPVFKNDAGRWEIEGRYRDILAELAKTEKTVVDLSTMTAPAK